MALTKKQKENIVSNLEQSIEKQKSIVFVGFDGVNVKEITQFRETLKDGGSEMKVAKKNLMRIALKNKDIDFEPQKLGGEVAMVFGYDDEIAPSKLSYDFSKKNEKIKIYIKIVPIIVENPEFTLVNIKIKMEITIIDKSINHI